MKAFHNPVVRRAASAAFLRGAASIRAALAVLLLTLAGPFLAEGVTVTIVVGPGGGLGFSPRNHTIHTGDTVFWDFSQQGPFFHLVFSSAAGNCQPDQEPIFASGSSFSYTFNQPGTYPYMCVAGGHCGAGENGVITVLPIPTTGVNRGLTIQKTGASQYTIQWNAFLAQGLALRATPALVMPMWSNVAITPTTVGDKRQVVLTEASPATFLRVECTADGNQDLPDDGFVDNDCDGIDGNIAQGVFVSATTGNDANPGTPERPLATITQGIATAQAAGKFFIYVAAGDHAEPTINLPPAVFIVGGYNAGDWSRAESNISRILSTSAVAMTTPQNAVQVFLDHLTIVAANAPPGQSSYGIVLQPSFNSFAFQLNMRKCTVQAGDGGNGTNGGNGVNGNAANAVAGPGQDGCGGFAGPDALGCGGDCTEPSPAPGATSSMQCDGRSGGNGGAAGYTSQSGQPGGNAPFATCESGSGPGCGGGFSSTGPGKPGSDGSNGQAGNNGAAGNAGGSYGFFGWSVTNGQDGTSGQSGIGGGGGAGGNGGAESKILGFTCVQCPMYGGAGGGGGAAGCGGTLGQGGGSGGSSFAIYIAQARAFIDQCTIIAGNGGNGAAAGSGGVGGAGSAGSAGGAGKTATRTDCGGGNSQAGGAGGNGGNGGNGGHGGGGAGGSCVGLAYGLNSQVFGSNTYMTGSPGAGGTSPGNSGPAGGSAQVVTF
jgi:plastocyanin